MSLNKESAAYKNKLRYIAQYNREKTFKVFLSLNKANDKDIIDRLNEVPAKTTYIKELIRKDIKTLD